MHPLATLVLTEIVFLDEQINSTGTPARVVRHGGYKLPSDCFQQSGRLLKQLESINEPYFDVQS